MTQRTLSLTGTLPVPDHATTAEPVPEEAHPLVAAVIEVRSGRGDMAEAMRLFRAAELWVERESTPEGHVVRAVTAEGLRWLPVFTSLAQLALFAQASGRGDQEVSYGRVTGVEIIEDVLPELPHGTGMVLDPVAEHVLALPAVRGIVPDAQAVT